MKIPNIDLLKIGVLLIGIALLIIAALALKIYYDIQKRSDYYTSDFYAYCEQNYIIISASKDLYKVSVKNIEGNYTYCTFDVIKKGSEELCKVDIKENETKMYIVTANDIKKVVRCGPIVIRPVTLD